MKGKWTRHYLEALSSGTLLVRRSGVKRSFCASGDISSSPVVGKAFKWKRRQSTILITKLLREVR